MPTPHKHAALIKQWADGAIIEWRRGQNDKWREAKLFEVLAWIIDYEYRVKSPRPAYRLFLSRGAFTGVIRVNVINRNMCPNRIEVVEASPHFIKWMSDWIEYDPT